MRGLDLPALDRRLRTSSAAPLAVAFSGGGDSLALLLAAKAWVDGHGRSLIALTVDHGLSPASEGWTRACAGTAARLGVGFRALRWHGAKPTTGLAAAARAARHALLADAARAAGASVILLGHTADDLTEAAAMRAEGSSVGDPAEWAPSPAWPEGRGVFLLRPMLGVRREALRDWLRARGETWIDDPANEDPRFGRARARLLLPSREKVSAKPTDEGAPGPVGLAEPQLKADLPCAPSSDLLRRPPSPARGEGTLVLPSSAPAAHIAAACLCAGGTSRPPRGDRLARLVKLVRSGAPFTATLAGARIEGVADEIVFTRNAGEIARGGLAPMALHPGTPRVWDGRYELTALADGLTVRALAGLARRLPKAEQDALRGVPAAARPALPAVEGPDGPTCPILATDPPVRVRALVLTRFEAATGVVDSEPLV